MPSQIHGFAVHPYAVHSLRASQCSISQVYNAFAKKYLAPPSLWTSEHSLLQWISSRRLAGARSHGYMLSHAFAPITSLTKPRRYITFHNFASANLCFAELCLRVTLPFNVLQRLAEAERSLLAPPSQSISLHRRSRTIRACPCRNRALSCLHLTLFCPFHAFHVFASLCRCDA